MDAMSLQQELERQRQAGLNLAERLIDGELAWRQLVEQASGLRLSSELSELELRRQEVIHELIQTERHHCLTLALMRQVYLAGLRRLNESRANSTSWPGEPIDLERLFPALEELIQAHELFFAHLKLRLLDSCGPSARIAGLVGPLGDLLASQFRLEPVNPATSPQQQPEDSGTGESLDLAKAKDSQQQQQQQEQQQQQQHHSSGRRLLQAYGKFCGQQHDASRYYKHLMAGDKQFRQFIELCQKQNSACRQRGIPECYLLVTQRLTKYPLLIERLLRASADDKREQTKLTEALALCKNLLNELNQQLTRKELFEHLLDIYAHFSPKSFTILNRHLKFTKHDLLQHKRLRQLCHSDSQVRVWSATRRKLFPVLCLIMNDIIVFLRIESSSSSSSSSSAVAAAVGELAEQQAAAAAVAAAAPITTNGEHSQVPFHGQCALINVVANVLHPAHNHHHHHQAHQLHQHSYNQPLMAAGTCAGQTPTSSMANQMGTQSSTQPFSVKYYFANIDNKPSVISLAKLLIREKAALNEEQAEPRVYLISSSPRQPEMYELAFESRRHQANFVDKLKGCIEQHLRRLANGDELDCELDDELDHYGCHHDQTVEDNGADTTLTQLASDDDVDDDDDDDEDDDHDDEEDEDDADEDIQLIDSEEDEVLEYDLSASDEPGRTPRPKGDNRASLRPLVARPNSPMPIADASTYTKNLETGRACGVLVADSGLERLDIEQEIVEPPPGHCVTPPPAAAALAQAGDDSDSLEFATPRACAPNDATSSDAALDSGEGGLSERARDSMDESLAGRSAVNRQQKLRRRRLQRPRNVSNQSSSSSEMAHRQAIELIKGSCPNIGENPPTGGSLLDEFDSGRGHDSSSSASSSASSSNSRRLVGQHSPPPPPTTLTKITTETTTMNTTTTTPTATEPAEVLQVAASSAAALTTSNENLSNGRPTGLLMGTTDSKSCSSLAEPIANGQPANNGHRRPLLVASCSSSCAINDSSLSSSGSSCSSGQTTTPGPTTITRTPASLAHEQRATASVATKGAGTISDKKSIAHTSSCTKKLPQAEAKQRKLSTVSSMSSQLKLFSRLKSAGAGLVVSETNQACPRCQQNQHQTISGAEQANRQMRQQLRRATFIPEQKLEELRDLRIQLDKDKQEWQVKFDKMQEQLLNERRQLDLAYEKLKQDRQLVDHEREQLYRKLDVLKQKGILLSPSHKVIITTPSHFQHTSQLDGLTQTNNNNNNSSMTNNALLTNGKQVQQSSQVSLMAQHTHNQRLALNALNVNQNHQANHQSSIRIVHQQPAVAASAHAGAENQIQKQPAAVDHGQRPASGLFIHHQGATNRVPVHLSEAPLVQPHNQHHHQHHHHQQQQQQQQHPHHQFHTHQRPVSSQPAPAPPSSSASKFSSPFLGALSAARLLAGSSSSSANNRASLPGPISRVL